MSDFEHTLYLRSLACENMTSIYGMQALLGGSISKLMKFKSWLQSVIKKAIRYGYLPRSFCTLDELREDSDEKLFFSARYYPNHVLHRLLPQPKSIGYNLRQRTHNLTLPMEVIAVIKQNFVYRMLLTVF